MLAPMRSRRSILLVAAVAVAVGLASPVGAQAAYPTWSEPVEGPAPALFSGTLTFGVLGFPASATYTVGLNGPSTITSRTRLTSDSASENIVAESPWGRRYGATIAGDGLRVRQDTSEADTPIRTTIAFAGTVRPGAWGFAIGDVDVDRVVVGGTNAAGALTGEELQGSVPTGEVVFSQTTGDLVPDAVAWNIATRAFTGAGSSASGTGVWLQPGVDVSTVTVDQCRRETIGDPPGCRTSGSNSSTRIWVGVRSQRLTATVATTAGDAVPAATLRLFDASGTLLATETTDAAGAHVFPRVYAVGGYRLAMTAPDGYVIVGSAETTVDLTEDRSAAFSVERTASRVRKTEVVGRFRVATTVTVTGPGRLLQRGTVVTPNRRVRVANRRVRVACVVERTVRRSGSVRLVCTLNRPARLLLRTRDLRVQLVTVYAADGVERRATRTVRIPRFDPTPRPVTG